jgi:hypothetical protein
MDVSCFQGVRARILQAFMTDAGLVIYKTKLYDFSDHDTRDTVRNEGFILFPVSKDVPIADLCLHFLRGTKYLDPINPCPSVIETVAGALT